MSLGERIPPEQKITTGMHYLANSPPSGGGGARGGHQIPRPPSVGQDLQESCEEEGVLDLRGHMELGKKRNVLQWF